jgi:hypothetical protein
LKTAWDCYTLTTNYSHAHISNSRTMEPLSTEWGAKVSNELWRPGPFLPAPSQISRRKMWSSWFSSSFWVSGHFGWRAERKTKTNVGNCRGRTVLELWNLRIWCLHYSLCISCSHRQENPGERSSRDSKMAPSDTIYSWETINVINRVASYDACVVRDEAGGWQTVFGKCHHQH